MSPDHWQPPQGQSQGQSKDPPTPSTKGSHDSPHSQTASSHLRYDYKESPPKKRKATGPHAPNPAPPSNLSDPSPPFSTTSSSSRQQHQHQQRRAHSRQPSDTSQQIESRQRARTESGRGSLSEAESGSQRHQSAQPETRHPQRPAGPEMRTGSSFSGGPSERNSPKREPEGPS
jgi:hypothetical protein